MQAESRLIWRPIVPPHLKSRYFKTTTRGNQLIKSHPGKFIRCRGVLLFFKTKQAHPNSVTCALGAETVSFVTAASTVYYVPLVLMVSIAH
jgi:hypothetical protein